MVTSTAEPRLTVSLAPADKMFFISKDATMPSIQAIASLAGIDPKNLPALTYTWDVSVVMQPGKVPYSMGRSTSHPPIRQTTTTNTFSIPFTEIRGGNLTVSVSVSLEGKILRAKNDQYEIRGQNPTETALRAAGAPDALIFIMKQETGLRQFLTGTKASGYPMFSHDKLGGVGLGQITRPHPTVDQIWNWKENLKAAVDLYQQKTKEAKLALDNYGKNREFKELVDNYNKDRIKKLLAAQQVKALQKPSQPASQNTPLPAAKPVVPKLIIEMAPYTQEQLENETIRRYNGEPGLYDQTTEKPTHIRLYEYEAEIDDQGLLKVQVSPDGTRGIVQWHQVSGDERRQKYDDYNLPKKNYGDPDYVQHVRDQGK